MRYSVDGKKARKGARLGAIGRDHLGEIRHDFGRDHQLRHDRPPRPPRVAMVVHDENQPPAMSRSALYAPAPRRTRPGRHRVHRFRCSYFTVLWNARIGLQPNVDHRNHFREAGHGCGGMEQRPVAFLVFKVKAAPWRELMG
jgi:hypothetical protein